MRRWIAALMLAGGVGCGSSDSVAPGAAAISVRVVDDAGTPIDRTRVIVSMGADRIEELTNTHGIASVRVENMGEYSVRVLPRAGYACGSGPIMKLVTVGAGTASVAFTLMRDGVTQGTPTTPTERWW